MPNPAVSRLLGRRALAFSADFALYLALHWLVYHLRHVAWVVVVNTLFAVYKPWMEKKSGATWGKRWLKLKVQALGGGPLSTKQVLIRNSCSLYLAFSSSVSNLMVPRGEHGAIAESMITMPFLVQSFLHVFAFLFYLFGFLYALHPQFQRSFYDHWAGTEVVLTGQSKLETLGS